MNKKSLIILIAIIILIGAVFYFIFFYRQTCNDDACFSSAMSKCSAVYYVKDTEYATWGYIIKGEKKQKCIINVKLLQVKEGIVELEKIEGLDMDCSLPVGYVGTPHEDLSSCDGLLKEEMQEMMIQKMHSYILSNLGEIGEELNSPL